MAQFAWMSLPYSSWFAAHCQEIDGICNSTIHKEMVTFLWLKI